MTGSAVKYWLLLACVLITMYGSFLVWRHERAPEVSVGPAVEERPAEKSPPLTDFVLTDQNGQEFDSKSLQGKVWVGSFFFTNCPGACWRLNRALAGVQETNPSSETRFISITCDPDDDTPEALAKYAEHFKADPARWTFLTGDMDLIRRIGNDYFHVAVEHETHSDRAFLVDRNGQIRGRFRMTEPNQVEMFKKLLAQVEAEPREADATAESVDQEAAPPADRAPADKVPAAAARETTTAADEQ